VIGTTLGQYSILGEVGRGGIGVVYLAEHIELDARCAVKLLAKELVDA
jgi:serine/threonine protein kinase